MQSELETIIQNLVVQLSSKDITEYPLLSVYRHHMELIVHPGDQLQRMFDNVDLTNKELQDLFTCCGASIVTLNNALLGFRLNEFDATEPTAVYWIKCRNDLREHAMSDLYDTVKNFMDAIPETEHPGQRIKLNGCGGLISWENVLNQIAENPRNSVFGCLNHPRRFFSPSPDLYVKARDNRGVLLQSTSDYLSTSDQQVDHPVWFVVRTGALNTISL